MKTLLSFLNFGPVVLLAVCLCYFNYKSGGFELVKFGLHDSMKMAGRIAVLFAGLVILSGQITAYYSRKPGVIKESISGRYAVLKATAIGTILPGVMAAGPVLKKEWDCGNKMAIIMLLLSASLINWSGLLIKMPFFGVEITMTIYSITFGMVSFVLITIYAIKWFST